MRPGVIINTTEKNYPIQQSRGQGSVTLPTEGNPLMYGHTMGTLHTLPEELIMESVQSCHEWEQDLLKRYPADQPHQGTIPSEGGTEYRGIQ